MMYGCANMQMCECADEKNVDDLQICGCADEKNVDLIY